jgi:cytochrome c oxidase subunit 2
MILACELVAALLAVAADFGVLSPQARSEPSVQTIVVHAHRFAFVPSQITLKKGQTAKLVLVSDDVPHGLAIRGLGVQADIRPGKKAEVQITPTQVGDFPGTCSVYCGSGHRDMGFVIHVVE